MSSVLKSCRQPAPVLPQAGQGYGSGSRILVTLLYELQRRNLKRGIAALCLVGGNAVALAVERC